MSDILDDHLREQLAAALLGWAGGDESQLEHDANGRETPKANLGLGHRQGFVQTWAGDVGDQDGTAVDDDIDADSLHDTGDNYGDRPEDSRHAQQQADDPANEALPPLPTNTPLGSPPPEMSCRISHFPFSHPCDIPELMADHEDTSGTTTSPSMSGPATPSAVADVFRPLTEALAPDLELSLRPLPQIPSEPALPDKTGHAPGKSEPSDVSVSDGLGNVPEEDDANTDGVSLLTPTEVSCGHSSGERETGSPGAAKPGLLAPGARGYSHSISSLGSGSGSSGGWRSPNRSGGARKSVNFFSRIRSTGRPPPAEEECLERRSLTPAQLSSLPPQASYQLADGELPSPEGPPPASPLPSPGKTDASTTSRFLDRMAWLGDSQAKRTGAVFGVDLKDSIRVAPMKIRISHKGRSTSYRTFPLSVHKCCEFIRRAGGTDSSLFSSPGNAYHVASLKAIFSEAPSYGEHFQFEGSEYSVHDAARLILLFLEEMPKPLISPSVVKSWILLARQEGAIEPPCPRVETGLDFWTEALNRLPTANRNLAKHLLTLFAEVIVAATGTITEADARQLASAVSRALFHHDGDGGGVDGKSGDRKKKPVKRNVQPTLALAFLIKKRGEYAMSLDKASGNGASKRDSKMFLPSTKEILEWKGAKQ